MTASTQEREHVQARRQRILAYLDRGGQHSTRDIANALGERFVNISHDLDRLRYECEVSRYARHMPYLWERRR